MLRMKPNLSLKIREAKLTKARLREARVKAARTKTRLKIARAKVKVRATGKIRLKNHCLTARSILKSTFCDEHRSNWSALMSTSSPTRLNTSHQLRQKGATSQNGYSTYRRTAMNQSARAGSRPLWRLTRLFLSSTSQGLWF